MNHTYIIICDDCKFRIGYLPENITNNMRWYATCGCGHRLDVKKFILKKELK